MSTAPIPTNIALPSDQVAEGRTLGSEELENLKTVIESGTLTSTKGQFVKQLEADFASLMGAKHCHASASGSAALHTAFAAIDPEPGDEFITTSITDIGALTPIVYQGAIPVFADVDMRDRRNNRSSHQRTNESDCCHPPFR